MIYTEAKRIASNPLDKSSLAELAAFYNHYFKCPSCASWFHSPSRPKHPLSLRVVEEVLQKLARDSECRIGKDSLLQEEAGKIHNRGIT